MIFCYVPLDNVTDLLCELSRPRRHGMSPMSALGQKQTSRSEISMSALPPKADIAGRDEDVRFVPKADIGHFIRLSDRR
jgi:hypothetical protein